MDRSISSKTAPVKVLNTMYLKKIIYYGTLASSAFNIQPWKLICNDENLEVFIDSKRLEKKCLTDSNYKEIYVSVGAMIENMVVAAKYYGFKTHIDYFPQKNNNLLIANIIFEPDTSDITDVDKMLFNSLEKRWTNRNKMTKDNKVPLKQLEELNDIVKDADGFYLSLLDKRDDILEVARLSTISEKMKWDTETPQRKSYKWLRFTEKGIHDGVPYTHFGMSKLLGPLFKIVLKWQFVKVLNVFGMSEIVARKSRWVKAVQSPQIIAFYTENDDMKNWVVGGQLYEKMLLWATSNGIAVQPHNCIEEWIDVYNLNKVDMLPKKHRKKPRLIKNKITKLFHLPQEASILMLFAIGYAGGQMPDSIRRDVEDILRFVN